MSVLQFAPFSTSLEPGFWKKLSDLKLNEYGLNDAPRDILGSYTNGLASGVSTTANFDATALDNNASIPPSSFALKGKMILTNTEEDFKALDKKLLLDNAAKTMWDDIKTNTFADDFSLLNRVVMVAFADLKKYHYFYWFAYPAFVSSRDIMELIPPTKIEDRFTEKQIQSVSSPKSPFFCLVEKTDALVVAAVKEYPKLVAEGQKVLFAFSDPSTLPKHGGWPLRNLLLYISHHFAKQELEAEVVCWRERVSGGVRNVSHSIVLTVLLPSLTDVIDCPSVVGWEKNEKQNMGPKMVDLSASMDPKKLAEQAVDLNLKLMRWRLLPELDLDVVANTSCLLLGAGTLGCNVARALLGWGIRKITLVDSGRVSYSNPVRQSLFRFSHSEKGGKFKAKAAAEALKEIHPGVIAEGVVLSIPMPGHPVSAKIRDKVQQDVADLDQLIDNHDAIFLLMDTRESRWLPTLLGAQKQKIVINAALGFDSYLVVRHGVFSRHEDSVDNKSPSHLIPGYDLGCYFCNDVVAPGDSTRDRSLDQQCTVSRPGASFMAAAMATELLVSLLQHPLRGRAPGCLDENGDDEATSILGILPHQVLKKYEQDGFKFLEQVFSSPKFLEDLTGLTKLHEDTYNADILEFGDGETISE